MKYMLINFSLNKLNEGTYNLAMQSVKNVILIEQNSIKISVKCA